MNADDLFKMFDLKPTDRAVKPPPKIEAAPGPLNLAPDQPASQTALVVDDWDLRKGQELAGGRCGEINQYSMADFHAAAFQSMPKLAPACTDARRRQFIETMLESGEYKALHHGTKLNEAKSRVAAMQMAEKYGKLLESDRARQRQRQQAPTGPKAQAKQQREDDLALYTAAAEAADDAGQAVEDFDNAIDALGCGAGVGSLGGQRLPPEVLLETFRQVRENPLAHWACKISGAMRRYAQGAQRQKMIHGADELVGVKLDDTVEFLLTEELASLFVPGLREDTLRRLVEKETLAYDTRGVERVGKGPIIVLVDHSGSMNEGDPRNERGPDGLRVGDAWSRERLHKGSWPIAEAQAFAMTMAWIAQHQRRWCCLIGFSGDRYGSKLILPPGKRNDKAVYDWVTTFDGGGTTAEVLCQTLPNEYWQELIASGMTPGKTDLVIVSDGDLQVPWHWVQAFNKWKKDVKCRSIALLLGSAKHGFDVIMDEVHAVRHMDTTDKAIQSCFSI